MNKFLDSQFRILSDFQSSNRLRQQQDWSHPVSVQVSDLGPNLSDRYSEESSPNGASYTTVGKKNFQQANNTSIQEQFQPTFKEEITSKRSPKNRGDLSQIYSQDIGTSIVNSKSQANKEDTLRQGSVSNAYISKKSRPYLFSQNTIAKRQELILTTKKLIKKNLKVDVVLQGKDKLLQNIFKRLHSFIKVARVFTRSHSISADQVNPLIKFGYSNIYLDDQVNQMTIFNNKQTGLQLINQN